MPSWARQTLSPAVCQRCFVVVEQRFELFVGVVRIVVEQHDLIDVELARELDDVVDARVAPPDMRRILPVPVLRVVEQDIGVVRDFVAADPVGRLPLEIAADRRFVVGEVREHA